MTDDAESERYYVYSYIRAVTSKNGKAGTPYYIGKGKSDRAFKRHTTVRVPKDRSRIVMIRENLIETEALELEISEIAKHGRLDLGTGILRNLTNGGDGMSGLVRTPEHRAKQSAALKKYFEDPEARARNSAAQKKAKGTPEVRANHSSAQKKRYEDPEARAKQSAAQKKAKGTPEARAKTSAAGKKYFEDPEARARHSAAQKKAWIARKTKNQSSSATLPI